MTRSPAAALILATAFVAGCGGDHRELASVRHNEEVLRQLPLFPGAQHTSTSSSPFEPQDNEHAAPAGDTTEYTYSAPRGATPRRIVAFYEARLEPAWRCRRERFPVRDLDHPHRRETEGPNLTCSRSTARLTIDTLDLPQRFAIVAASRR